MVVVAFFMVVVVVFFVVAALMVVVPVVMIAVVVMAVNIRGSVLLLFARRKFGRKQACSKKLELRRQGRVKGGRRPRKSRRTEGLTWVSPGRARDGAWRKGC